MFISLSSGPVGSAYKVIEPVKVLPNQTPQQYLFNILNNNLDWQIQYLHPDSPEEWLWQYYDRMFRIHRAVRDGRPMWLDGWLMHDYQSLKIQQGCNKLPQIWIVRDDPSGLYLERQEYLF